MYGVKAYDNVLMFKILLLQKYYNLSDKAVEEALYTNILFMKFVGLSLEDNAPDDTTICRFRNSLIKNSLLYLNLGEINGLISQTILSMHNLLEGLYILPIL